MLRNRNSFTTMAEQRYNNSRTVTAMLVNLEDLIQQQIDKMIETQ